MHRQRKTKEKTFRRYTDRVRTRSHVTCLRFDQRRKKSIKIRDKKRDAFVSGHEQSNVIEQRNEVLSKSLYRIREI